MLKITMHTGTESVLFTLEGRLTGPWVHELAQYWKKILTRPARSRVKIDLRGVTYIDAEGKTLLAEMYRHGAEFQTAGCLTNCIIEDIKRAEQTEPSDA
ncbi:MAG: hypothetical protein C4293_17065 [Nitrospiraceae bacterium]